MGQKDRPNYWKNAALLTGSDAGMIETYGGEYLEGAADACEKLLKK